MTPTATSAAEINSFPYSDRKPKCEFVGTTKAILKIALSLSAGVCATPPGHVICSKVRFFCGNQSPTSLNSFV